MTGVGMAHLDTAHVDTARGTYECRRPSKMMGRSSKIMRIATTISIATTINYGGRRHLPRGPRATMNDGRHGAGSL